MLLVANGVGAADAVPPSTNSVPELSLEELVNANVTSVSKKEENLNDAAASIFVLNNDDIRRSGATSIAEALRLVPGLNVATVNAADSAISARGFSGPYANKLLVLVDGRAVYSPIFSGVFWDLQQMNLEDVDRIEVIRGPGGTIWGANAMNGVINVVSKSARDTQGSFVEGSGGDVHLTMDGARYGGKIGEHTCYRVDGGYQLTDAYPLANGQSAGDGWQSERAGFRLDHYPSADTHMTWHADSVVNQLDKHKVLQILVNLIRNAKHACHDSERADRRLTVRVAEGEGLIKISVIDNGVGIPPENLTRIFSHGFTTRKDGHGFGLHSGALAAKEMGGSLTVHSDGLGRGATFTLDLPVGTSKARPITSNGDPA